MAMVAALQSAVGQAFLFRAMNALVDGGWLKRLKALEVSVLLVYLRHADRDGFAYPRLDTVAAKVGHKRTNHVHAARKRLVESGLMEVKRDDRGRDVCQILIPHPTLRLVPNRDQSQSQIGTAFSPRSGPTPVPIRDRAHKEEQPIEQPIEVPPNPPQAGGGGRRVRLSREERKAAKIADEFDAAKRRIG